MKTLTKWLDEEVGRSKALAKHLCVGEPMVSQVKKGHRKIPQNWMPHIQDFTKGEITIVGMVEQQAKGALQKRKARARAKVKHG